MLDKFRLSVSDVPLSYPGKLFFILGPGLGDTVNDFRILHEVLLRYVQATAIVYADPRWKALCELLPDYQRCVWRYHIAAPSGELAGKEHEQSYSETLRGVFRDIQVEIDETSGFIAIGGYTCLDQLAQKEMGLATKARAIGLPLSQDLCRPYLPVTALPMDEAKEFLRALGLREGQYVALAPQTWADKAWSQSGWQQLTQGLLDDGLVSILVLGTNDCEVWQGPNIYKGLGLPLPLVAALIAQSQCFVGLDSGLTHVAACFDIPIVGLQAQGKFPPFLVEPHSPFRRIHLTPFVYGSGTISPESIQGLIKEALRDSRSPSCPSCNQVSYVLGVHAAQTVYLCRCGLVYRRQNKEENPTMPAQAKVNDYNVPCTIEELGVLKQELIANGENLVSSDSSASRSFTFDHWNVRELSVDTILSDNTGRELWWSWDAVHHVFATHGWEMVKSRGVEKAEPGLAPYSFEINAKPSSRESQDVLLQVPWGGELVWLQRSLYLRWLSWESFERSNELEDLAWRLVKEGYERDGRDILRFAAKREWRGRTLGRLLRSEWKALETGLKNSQDATAHA